MSAIVQVSNLMNNQYSAGTTPLTFPNPPTVGNLLCGIAYAYEQPGANSAAGWATADVSYQSSVVVFKYVTEEDALSSTVEPFSFNVYGQSGIVWEISGCNSASPILNMRINDSGPYANNGTGNPFTDPGLAVNGPAVALSYITQFNEATGGTSTFTLDAFQGTAYGSFGGVTSVIASHQYYLAGDSASNTVTFTGANNNPVNNAPSAIQASILVLVESYDVPGAPPQNPNVVVPESSVIVTDGANFQRTQSVALYNGGNDFDTANITNIIGNQLYLDAPLAYSYAEGTSVLILRNRGVICTVDADANLKNIQKVQTQSYFQELNNFVATVEFATAPISGGYECGWVMLKLLQQYQPEIDIVIDPANIVYSETGSVSGGGTGQAFSGQYANTSLLQIIKDIQDQANGGISIDASGSDGAPSGSSVVNGTYRCYIDEHLNYYYGPINTTTPSVTAYLDTWQNEFAQNGSYDMVSGHTQHWQDTTGIVNVYKGVGANVGLNNVAAITATLADQNSVNIYGQREQYVTAPQINSQAAMLNYLQTLLDQNAYPLTQYVTTIYPSRRFITCSDFVAIAGFEDAPTRVDTYTPQTVETSWKAMDYSFYQQKITGGVLIPDVNKVMRNIANQRYTAVANGIQGEYTNLDVAYVQTGIEATTSGNTLNLSAGVVGVQVN